MHPVGGEREGGGRMSVERVEDLLHRRGKDVRGNRLVNRGRPMRRGEGTVSSARLAAPAKASGSNRLLQSRRGALQAITYAASARSLMLIS